MRDKAQRLTGQGKNFPAMREETGLLIKGLGGLYEVKTQKGEVFACRALGNLKRGEEKLLIGDRVRIRIDESGRGETAVTGVLPRKNVLIRPPLSNISMMFLTVAPLSPAPSLSLIDKMTVICAHEKITPVLLVTKSDLDATGAESLAALYRSVGLAAFVLSSATGEGAEDVRTYLGEHLGKEEIACFAGVSGVGKSSLVNLLFPGLTQETGSLSEKTGRGRHTTRHVELFPCFGGYIADTPGFSLLDFLRFDFVSLEELPSCFPEFAPFLGACRYGDCTHASEEGCAVREGVKEGKIPGSRYGSYQELYAVLREKEKNRFSR